MDSTIEYATLKDYFENLIITVKLEIQTIESNESDILTTCKKVISYLQDIGQEVKKNVKIYGFHSKEEEILFFKELKPQIVSLLIFYNAVFTIEVKCPNGSNEVEKLYYKSELSRLTAFFDRNLTFYQYYRTNSTYLDEKYFLRGKPDIQIIIDSFYFETDPEFNTSYDFKVSKILANELLKIYLMNRIHELERGEIRDKIPSPCSDFLLTWTGTKAALVELIYAIDACGYLNKGNFPTHNKRFGKG